MDSPISGSGSTSSLYTQQNQATGIPSASAQESGDSSRLETQLPSQDSYPSGEGPADTPTTDRTVYPQPGDSVTPKLSSVANMTISESDHDADVKGSESDGKSQTSRSSQAELLPEAKAASYQAVPDIVESSNDSGVSKVEKNDLALEPHLIKATQTLPMDADQVAMMFRLIGKIPGDNADHNFRFNSNSGEEKTEEKTIARDLEGRYQLSFESGNEPDETKDLIHLAYIPFYSHSKSPIIASQNLIPIKVNPENNQCYVDIDFQNKAFHVVAYLSPIPTDTSATVSLSMTRICGLTEIPSAKTDDKSIEAEGIETSASQPEGVSKKAAHEDESKELPEASETDFEELRKDSSLLSCCGIRERTTKPHPAAGT